MKTFFYLLLLLITQPCFAEHPSKQEIQDALSPEQSFITVTNSGISLKDNEGLNPEQFIAKVKKLGIQELFIENITVEQMFCLIAIANKLNVKLNTFNKADELSPIKIYGNPSVNPSVNQSCEFMNQP